MIKILPVAGKDGEFQLLDGEVACGRALADFSDEVRILEIEAPDALLMEGMVRAVLNAGRVRELRRAVCQNEALFPILKHLEFTPCDEGMQVDIMEFFFRGCKGH